MYVWEVREEVDYEGRSWSILVKDDEYALEKIKKEIIKHYNVCCYYKDIREEQVEKVSNLKHLDDFQSFKTSIGSRIEVEKTRVI